MMQVAIRINGRMIEAAVPDCMLLVEFLREVANLRGTLVGCDTTQCGCCTVHVDGAAVKSCSMLAAQASGASVTTIEGLSQGEGLHPLQRAFREHHALQCGYCTPGMIMNATDFLSKRPNASEREIRHLLEGNICRCTGYENIVSAILHAAEGSAAR